MPPPTPPIKGELSKKEFGKAVRSLGFSKANKAEIDAVFDLLDPDKSGKIDYQELDKSIRRINQERKGAKEEAKKEAMEKQLKRQNTAKPESLQKRK